MEERWSSDIINWEKITDKQLTLMLNQCETVLKETLETAKTISTKTDKLLSINIPVFSGLVIYLISNLNQIGEYLHLTAFLSLIIVGISLFFCTKNLHPYQILVHGEVPKRIVRSEFIDNDYTPDEQYIMMILNICENLQSRIDANDATNNIRSINNERSRKTFLLLIFCPFVAGLAYLLLVLCSHGLGIR